MFSEYFLNIYYHRLNARGVVSACIQRHNYCFQIGEQTVTSERQHQLQMHMHRMWKNTAGFDLKLSSLSLFFHHNKIEAKCNFLIEIHPVQCDGKEA